MMNRRAAVRAALLMAGAGELAACGGPDSGTRADGTPIASTPPGTPGTEPTASRLPVTKPATTPPARRARAGDWRALAAGLRGSVLRSGEQAYDEHRVLFGPRFDDVRPAAVVRCEAAEDVSEALGFACRFGLDVVARAGGHSYVGASTVRDGIVLDVRPMRTVEVDGDSAWVGAGALLGDVYAELAAAGRAVPAGTCPTVGIAGLALGGGLGLASRTYGLTCDALEEVEVVTADGVRRMADKNREPELFWACCGGGGGTVGVVTRFRLRTFRSGAVGQFRASWSWDVVSQVVAGWQRWLRRADGDEWANLNLGRTAGGGYTVSVFGVDFGDRPEDSLDRLVADVGAEPYDQSALPGLAYGAMGGYDRVEFWAGSDILAEPLPGRGQDRLRSAIEAAAGLGAAVSAIVDPLGGAVARVGVDQTAFPWRQAFASVQWYAERGYGDGPAAQRWIATAHRELAPWTAGSYVNYLESAYANGSRYFGPNTRRLSQVKARYDPDALFPLPYRL